MWLSNIDFCLVTEWLISLEKHSFNNAEIHYYWYKKDLRGTRVSLKKGGGKERETESEEHS